MKKKLRLIPLIALAACAQTAAPPALAPAVPPLPSSSVTAPASVDQKFEGLARGYIEDLLRTKPELATALGDHRYDARLNDYTMAGVAAERKLAQEYLAQLNQIPLEHLSSGNRVDYRTLKHNLEGLLFSIDVLREYEWNPLYYNPGNSIYGLLARQFAPLGDRLKNAKERLKGFATVLQAARTQLKNPPRIHVETAITQNRGNLAMIRDDLNVYLNQVPDLKADFALLQGEVVRALEAYGAWLEKEVLPQASGDFRLGEEKFRKKLYYSLESDLTKQQILEFAERELTRTQDEMYETALPLYRKFAPKTAAAKPVSDKRAVIRAVLDQLAATHPNNDNIVELAKTGLARQTEFVRSHKLMTLPSDPVKIIVMPEFQRGVTVAYCDSPGPLEKNGETFYAISPTPANWSATQVESFYREYNNYMLENLTIHEAMPGHYLQIAHANRFKAPTLVRAVFASGTFIEGWATYAEQVMVEAGYGGPELKLQQLKMRLRLLINSILDQKIHTAGMNEQEALDLMMNQGFQEKGEASGKWRRAALTSTQLSTYLVGNIEVNAIRKAFEAKLGSQFSLQEFHDTLLSFGSPAPKYLRELLRL